MTPIIGCERARVMLSSFLDDEIATSDQVALDVHLRWCQTCSAHVADLRTIGDALRLGAEMPRGEDSRDLDGLRAGVLSRLNAESARSWAVRGRRAVREPIMLWAGVGATLGLAACFFLTMRVATVVMDRRAADSMAAIIDTLGRPGSDGNPVALGGGVAPPRLSIPRLFDDSPELASLPDSDAFVTLSTVVTREGRIADFSVVRGNVAPGDLLRLHSAVANLRFAPAHSGGAAVAVNIVWVMARTTVRGSFRPFDFDEFRPRPRVRPVG